MLLSLSARWPLMAWTHYTACRVIGSLNCSLCTTRNILQQCALMLTLQVAATLILYWSCVCRPLPLKGVFQSLRLLLYMTVYRQGGTHHKILSVGGACGYSSSTTLMLQPSTWKVNINGRCCCCCKISCFKTVCALLCATQRERKRERESSAGQTSLKWMKREGAVLTRKLMNHRKSSFLIVSQWLSTNKRH